METISVVVPTHNRPALLRQTLTAIRRQRAVDLDVVVVDDGSHDSTEVESAIADCAGVSITLLRNERPSGLSSARNQGVAAARSEWIAFCDDDDLWAPDKTVAQLAAAVASGCGWAYAGAVNVTLDGRVIGGAPPVPPNEVSRQLPMRNPVPGGGSGVIVRRELLTKAGPFDTGMAACEDWDMWVRLSRLDRPAWVSRPLVGYRVHGTAMSLDVDAVVAAAETIEQRYGGPLDRETLYRHMARVALRGGRRGTALRWYARAALESRTYRRSHLGRDVSNVARAALRLPVRDVIGSTSVSEHTIRSYRAEAREWLDQLALPHLSGPSHSSA